MSTSDVVSYLDVHFDTSGILGADAVLGASLQGLGQSRAWAQPLGFAEYDEVMSHVIRYFRFIENQLREEARLKSFDDDLLRA